MKEIGIMVMVSLIALCVLQRGCQRRAIRFQERRQQKQEQKQERIEDRRERIEDRREGREQRKKRFMDGSRRFKRRRQSLPLRPNVYSPQKDPAVAQ